MFWTLMQQRSSNIYANGGLFMYQQWSEVAMSEKSTLDANAQFFIETIEVTGLAPLSFFEAGEQRYREQRFYWQNKEKTCKLVGLGHAYVIENCKGEARFRSVEQQWKDLTQKISVETSVIQPILFGGFTFDPKNTTSSEWGNFPHAYFVVATHQMIVKNGKSYVSIHAVVNKENSGKLLEKLRKERDALIHMAQLKSFKTHNKPSVVGYDEPYKEQYLSSIDKVTSLIRNKQAEKVVIARSLAMQFTEKLAPSLVLSNVMNEQPDSYLFGLERGQLFFFGASPERLVKVHHGMVYSSCIAGSTKRGKSVEEDEQLGQSLLQDAKNREEHHYVVEMIAKVFADNCLQYEIPECPILLKSRDIQHLYTPVEGTLQQEATIMQLVEQLHPTPALGGVPSEQALTIIRQYEAMNRGMYAAPIGWLDVEGNGEFAVAIRSATLTDCAAHLYAGGGIVADSEAGSEYEETLMKFRPMLRALGGDLNE